MGLKETAYAKEWMARCAGNKALARTLIFDAPNFVQGRAKDDIGATIGRYCRAKARDFVAVLREGAAQRVVVVFDRTVAGDKGDVAKRHTRLQRRMQHDAHIARHDVTVGEPDVDSLPEFVGDARADTTLMPTPEEWGVWRRHPGWWTRFVHYLTRVVLHEAATSNTVPPGCTVIVDGHAGAAYYESVETGCGTMESVVRTSPAPAISEADLACAWWVAHSSSDDDDTVCVCSADTDLFAILLMYAHERGGGGGGLLLSLHHRGKNGARVEVTADMVACARAVEQTHGVFTLVFYMTLFGCDYNERPNSLERMTGDYFLRHLPEQNAPSSSLLSLDTNTVDATLLAATCTRIWRTKGGNNRMRTVHATDEGLMVAAARSMWTLLYWRFYYCAPERVPEPTELDDATARPRWGYSLLGLYNPSDWDDDGDESPMLKRARHDKDMTSTLASGSVSGEGVREKTIVSDHVETAAAATAADV